MLIPLGRRRLVIHLTSSRSASGTAAAIPLIAAESDREFVRLATRRNASFERAQRDVSLALHGPQIH